MGKFRFFVLVVIWVGVMDLKSVLAQDTASPEPTLKERMDALDQKVRILQRQGEIDKENAAAKAKDASILSAGGKDGVFTLRSSDDSFRLRVGGYIQADGRFYLKDNSPRQFTDSFSLRRVRPLLEGTVGTYYDFRIMPDFGAGTASLQDAYLSVNYWPGARFQAGKFKEPVGLERLQAGAALLFVERALPTNLVPNRDVGVQVFGDLWTGVLSYTAGYFDGVVDVGSVDNDPSLNKGKDAAARIFVQPFKASEIESLQGLGFGIAGTYGREKGSTATPNLPSYKSAGAQSPAAAIAPATTSFFVYRSSSTTPATNAFADGRRTRYTPQLYYYFGPFGLLAEYVRSSQEVRQASNFRRFSHSAEQIAVSYVLTGEAASYKGVKPKREFDPRKGDWGALEVKARCGTLTIDDNAFPVFADPTVASREAREMAAGINWHLSRNVKFVLDYSVTEFHGGGGGTTTAPLDRATERVVFERFQVVF
jgi:phosphate-selective porin OprO/OprP